MNEDLPVRVVNPATVEDLIEKMQKVEQAAVRAWGQFSLFGLFEREDTPGAWDVIVSAPWLKPDREGILTITHYISDFLSLEEALLVARVVPLPPESDFVRMINDLARDKGQGFLSVGPVFLANVEINRAYILASQKNPPVMQTAAAA